MKETLLEVSENKDVIFSKSLGPPEFYPQTLRKDSVKNTFLKSQSDHVTHLFKTIKALYFGVKTQSLKWFKSTQIFLRNPFSNHHLSDLGSYHSLNSLRCIYTNFAIPLTHWKFSLFKAFTNTLYSNS